MSGTEEIKKRYDRVSGVFDMMDHMIKDKWRKDLLKDLDGSVLEIGVGTGANLPFYPETAEVTGIDFSRKMLKKAEEKAAFLPGSIALREMDAENLEFPDDSFDYVVSTCVFCSVPDPVRGLREINRVVKPEGKVLMLEHMRSDTEWIGKMMDVLNPVGLHIVGANINRETMTNIQKAGLRVEEQELLFSTIMRKLVLTSGDNGR
ncbi:SAM-dependent methyltransferase [Salimicrobium jeotgali]|uniref:Methyltransferase type 11 n=1 Tax=Salimicrobium jeotgali TaxID=1230341 RepID=K2FM62_9BACI|nr:class I SAM-dependent methyltransferase [Salimicrobium jeotgali]AKG03541.1 SAM-dependent methyltransferase [Salimicrobium jeotgali]EKE32031.1 methyltransferase type 11 [Salimicrobium jeotgali]MBM7695997.1 ubiquinone/menaquinone biosynthesis C-methylase UbiE [Salimicrobium jeotgali]